MHAREIPEVGTYAGPGAALTSLDAPNLHARSSPALRADSSGVEISYRVEGDGPATIVMLPGMGSRVADWGPTLVPALAARHRLVLIDHRGSGESTVTPPDFSLEDMARDVLAVMDHAAIAKAHVLGFSLGGMVAQILALEQAARVDKVVLINTHFGGQEFVAPTERGAQIVRPRSYKGSGDLAERSRDNFAILTTPGFAAAHPELVERFVRGVLARPTSALGFMGQVKAAMLSDRSKRVARLARPVLVLQSLQDEVSRPANGEMLAARIPGARLETIDGSGHFVMWDQPLLLAQRVLAFLAA
jgi:3-oxoadipate enol-lactonase